MKTVLVRYRVKPDHVEENKALVREVFAELKRTQPDGLRYASFLMPDGVSFVHVAATAEGQTENPLTGVPAFQRFVADIKARCDEPPAPTELETVGNYRLLSE